MTVNDLCFPVICFQHIFLRVRHDAESLTTSTTAGLKNGFFRDLLVVDTRGTACKVRDAKKLHGVGWFGGYNLFLNQRIKVELVFEEQPFHISVEEVRRRVLDSFRQWSGWQTRGDFDELKAAVERAPNISDIIRLLAGKTVPPQTEPHGYHGSISV